MTEIIRINSADEDELLEFVGVDNAGDAMYNYWGKPFTGFIDTYNENNVLIDVSEFTDGHIGGLQQEFYDSGQIQHEYYQYFGRIDKYFKSWNEHGELISHSIWKDGERIESILMEEEERKNHEAWEARKNKG